MIVFLSFLFASFSMNSVGLIDTCTSSELASAALVIPSQPEDQPESLDTLGLVDKIQSIELHRFS